MGVVSEPEMPAREFLGDMPAEQFRESAHAAADWIADYLERVSEYPPLSQARPGAVADALPNEAPAQGEPIDRIMADLDRLLMPGITHWVHPRFFAYFGGAGSAAGILGEMLTAGLNVNAMLWRTSPAAT